ncbi:unnamed protein product [Adineta steineri]|uniref:Kinesin light chain n=1 Tax=Adineta steineri TaxID=433720 RepID=A0A818VZT4_9BILA|nr:unnamed protein product [Adineta steineri]CAF3718158.1 unnamed protein product [Adineta steineri]
MPQLDAIYIFCSNKSRHQGWTQNWKKVIGVHTNIEEICLALQLAVKQCNQDSIAVSFITAKEMALTDNLNQLEPTFMYTQIFKEILLDMEYGKQAIRQFTAYCRNNNAMSPINTDRFETEYHAQLAVWWYTFPSTVYSILNDGLRTLDADAIIIMCFFICHLHQQIQRLYEQQISTYKTGAFIVYRGQGLMKSDFEKLQKTIGGLMSFNSFLSTSKYKDVSLDFARCASTKVDTVGIFFIMYIDPCIKSAPFASIKQLNKKLTSDDDQQLRLLTNRIGEEVSGTGWQRLGKLLLTIGQFNKAEELYNVLLEQTSDENEKVIYYNQLGFVHSNHGDYEKAIWYHEDALEIQQKALPLNHLLLAMSYNNIASVYTNMGEYSKALSLFEKTLEMYQKTLPSNHPDIATAYNNIGRVYDNMGQYSTALSFYKKDLQICLKTLPSNHPDLAASYNNIGLVYYNMEEYSKALSAHKKALEIYQKTLPSNHPDMATAYNNIGRAYDNMGQYSTALSFYKKDLEICLKTLPSNHPNSATSYSNIGSVYFNMGQYPTALSFYEKAIEIYQKTLPSDHPSLAISYNKIGSVYSKMGGYSKAISSHEKALEIYQKMFPSNHPSLAISNSNIGSVYYSMGEYSKAISFYEKAV